MARVSIADAIKSARKECFTDEDAYWISGTPSFLSPLNPRNEAAALSKLAAGKSGICKGIKEAEQQLEELCSSYSQRLATSGVNPDYTTSARGTGELAGGYCGTPFDERSLEAELARWCKQQGMTSLVEPACFKQQQGGSLRGLMASCDIAAGDTVVSVPMELLVSYNYIMASDLGAVLQRIPGLGEEAAAVIWTMVDRQDTESALASYWRTLPSHFGTGLGVSQQALDQGLPAGCLLHAEAVAARQHLRQQHQELQPVFTALCQAYPSFLSPHLFTWEAFVWTAELWYAYAITVQLPGGELQPCLVPFVGLMNHSSEPHIVHYSKVDEATKTLRLMCFRPCTQGQEVLLSYGPLTNAKLLLFYGFVLPNNPFDSAAVPLELPREEDTEGELRQALLQASGLDAAQQRVRAAAGPLPEQLLACFRLAAASKRELLLLKKSKKAVRRELLRPLSIASERAALEMLQAALTKLQQLYQDAGQAVPCTAANCDGGGSRESDIKGRQSAGQSGPPSTPGGAASEADADRNIPHGSDAGTSSQHTANDAAPSVVQSNHQTGRALSIAPGSADAAVGADADTAASAEATFLRHCHVWIDGQVHAVGAALMEVQHLISGLGGKAA